MSELDKSKKVVQYLSSDGKIFIQISEESEVANSRQAIHGIASMLGFSFDDDSPLDDIMAKFKTSILKDMGLCVI